MEWNDETQLYPETVALRQQNPNVKILIAVGGWCVPPAAASGQRGCAEEPRAGGGATPERAGTLLRLLPPAPLPLVRCVAQCCRRRRRRCWFAVEHAQAECLSKAHPPCVPSHACVRELTLARACVDLATTTGPTTTRGAPARSTSARRWPPPPPAPPSSPTSLRSWQSGSSTGERQVH